MRAPATNLLRLGALCDLALGFSAAAFVYGHVVVGAIAMGLALFGELLRGMDRERRLREHAAKNHFLGSGRS